ncbi:MAG: YCF48-related protein, partial [Bacteroidia bacterium]
TVDDLDCDGKNDELDISWPVATGAEEYQLEWTFVNDYDTIPSAFIADTDLDFSFRNNSTRVTTVNNNYRIPLLFDHGYVLFRVRAIGRVMTDPTQLIFGIWSDVENGTVDVALDAYHVTVPHESSLNWQVTTTFAEEGKKKEVISYFDGSLRSREVVTRINSDSNVVVGETIYDHQGRPAVNVLPAPVAMPSCSAAVAPALHFYPNFNQDDSTKNYSLNDFDIDGSGGACTVDTVGMNVSSGASNYYSPVNGNMNSQQAFVPDAQRFPFSRVEYTPDNTGRIRRQSGVGPEFQLGTGHESNYYYGQPNQIQLDRLFGSEAGDATHYKKNVVIDPNGQASVSYLDQEGRVIATALGGDAAPNTSEIASAAPAAVPFTIDLFAKDANGNSRLNSPNIPQTATEFSSQLLVPYAGDYFFDYNMVIDTLLDSCLRADVCFSCVYDMEIKVTDECGTNLALVAGDSIRKTIGHFTTAGDTLIFSADCEVSTSTTESDTFTVYLPVGSYTISKILTVNKAAQDFYVAAYLDTTFNLCVKTLSDFEAEFLAAVDTSDCYINCATCAAALGDRDSYVASGKGSALDYDVQMEKCGKMCKQITPCELAYEMMLKDVSPGGQYGEFFNATTNLIDPTVFPLSVLNNNNNLSYSYRNSGTGDWHYPLANVNGTNYPYYFDEDGTRSRITVSYTTIHLDSLTNTYYIYPEELDSIQDFIAAWLPSWAKSLVQYHPEYCYYETCKQYSEKQIAADSTTSDEFDILLRSTNTFSDAVAAGLIKTSYLTFPDPNDRLEDWFTISTTLPYDPFVTNTGSFGIYATSLLADFNSFLSNTTGTYTMLEAAAVAVRCGNNYGVAPGASCLEFGKDYIVGGPSYINDSIRDMEWSMLKSFYLSAKGKWQNERGDYIALHSCEALNDCIGEDENANLFTNGMLDFSSWPGTSPYHDQGQPCSVYTYPLYVKKQKRFPDQFDFPSPSAQDVAYQLYMQTGQCPAAYSLQDLMGAIAAGDNLDSDSLELISYAQYNAFYIAKNNFAPQYPITTEDYDWYGVDNGDTLDVYWINPINGDTVCTLLLDKSSVSISNWDDILGFKDLQASGYDGTNFSFTVLAVLPPDSGSLTPYSYEQISGYTSCVNILDCSFPLNCKPNAFASDIQFLMTALAINNNVLDSAVNLEDSIYQPLITNRIRLQLGAPNSHLTWTFHTTDSTFVIRDTAAGSNKIVFSIRELIPNTTILDSIGYFLNITGAYEHFFEVDGYKSNGNRIVHIKGKAWLVNATDTSEISMGNCEHPTPMACDENEHHIREDLQHLLDEKLSERPFNGNIDLFQSLNLTPLLQSYLAFGDSSTTSVYLDTVISGIHSDTLIFTIDGCYLELWHRDSTSPVLSLDSLVGLTDLTGIGATDAQGNYHDFYAISRYIVSGVEYTDTIYGTSCWPLKNCFPCPDTNVFSGESLMALNFSSNIVTPTISVAQCSAYYTAYNNFIRQYNDSGYAAWSGVYLDTTFYYNFNAFVLSGKCSCEKPYEAYLLPYLSFPADTTLPPPVALEDYGPCLQTAGVPDDPCKDAYYNYIVAVGNYNDFASANPSLGFDSLAIEYAYTQFTSDSLCYCVDAFVALVDAIIDGQYNDYPDSAFTLLHIADYCDLVLAPPCSPNLIAMDTVLSPIVPYTNPCVEYKINLALANALLTYHQYIDSLTTLISDRYRQHCLGAVENFTATYTDKEYHFTLYYYDQAGNLVKTVPPEGVELLPLDSVGDSLQVVIQNDRLNSTHTVFTQHRMATHYEYNSLNQLVRQSMPDQDNMDIWETTLPNGLDSRFKASQSQFVTATRGYLCGFVDLGSGNLRGYVYVTDDGGITWKRFGGEVGSDMNKIQWASSAIAYAVGDYGTVIKTIDGGNTWSMLNVWGTSSWTGTDIVNNLNDLYFTSTTSGLMVGDNCLLLKTTNGGTSFTAVNMVTSNGLQTGDNITSVTYDGSAHYITVNRTSDNTSFISKSTDGGSTWTAQTSVQTMAELRKVQYYGTDSAYAAGADGTLLHTVNDGVKWNVVATSTADKFLDIYFRNADEGIAIIENTSGQGELWKTFDAGNTWAMLGTAGDEYNALYPYEDNSAGAKVVAVGSYGKVSRVIMQANTGYGVIDLASPNNGSANSLQTATATFVGSNLWVYVAGNHDTLYYTTDATASFVTWTKLVTGLTGSDKNVVHIEAMQTTTGTNPSISGVLLTSTGKLQSFFKYQNTSSYTFTAFTSPTPASNNFADLAVATSTIGTGGDTLLAFNNTDQKLYYIPLSATVGTYTATVVSANAAGYTTISSISKNGSDLMLVTTDGSIVRGQFSLPSTATYTDRTKNLVNIDLQTIQYSGSTGKVYAAGIDGNVVQQNSSGNWRILPSGTAEQLNALDFNTTTTGLMAGNNGTLFSISTSSTSVSCTPVNTYVTEDLYDISRTSNQVYVAGANGTLLYALDITTGNIATTTVSTSGNLKGVAVRTSYTYAVAVGDHAHVRLCNGATSMQNKQVFTPALRNIHFTDANNGYLVGVRFTVRKTTDGGLTWNVVLPVSSSVTLNTNMPDLNAVYTLPNGEAV